MNHYRDVVTIQQDSSSGDEAEPDYSGAALVSGVPCRIQTIGGDESFRGRMLEAHTSHVVEMQWLEGVRPSMRLSVTGGVHSGTVLNITSVRPIERGGRVRKLELYCVRNDGR